MARRRNKQNVDTSCPFVSLVNYRPLPLQDLLRGRSAFLVLSGPSLNTIDTSLMLDRGIATIAVNNAATVVRPTFWTHGDPVEKFHPSIWRDAGIMKFPPWPKATDLIVEKQADGTFKVTDETPATSPNTVGILRNANFDADAWLHETTVNWGNGKREAAVNNQPHLHSTMIQAIKLAYLLGVRKLFLVGCDFYMPADRPYAFDESKHYGGCGSNNRAYVKICYYLDLLAPRFKEAGFEVYNCNPRSNLRTFPFVSYGDAIVECRNRVANTTDTAGYYGKLAT